MNTLEMVLDLAYQRFAGRRKETIEEQLDNVLKRMHDDTDKKDDEDAKEHEYLEQLKRSGECVKKSGTITKLQPTYGMIDHQYRFEISLSQHFHNISEGCRISYLAYKQPDGITKVVKIESVLQEVWDNCGQNEERMLEQAIDEYFQVHMRRFNGTIVAVTDSEDGTIVDVETEVDRKVSVNIAKVQIQFKPAAGDEVVLTCKVQTDDHFVDFSGAVLDYVAINPVRTAMAMGKVTSVTPSGGGKIDKNIAFSPAALEPEYKPQVGDLVTYDALENNKNNCTWRCLKVVLSKRSENSQEAVEVVPVVQNERGIVVSDIPTIFLSDINQTAPLEIRIKNNHTHPHKLYRTIIPIAKKLSQLELLSPDINASFDIAPGQEHVFKMMVKGRFCGFSTEKIVWKFARGLFVERKIEIQVGDDDSPAIIEFPRYQNSRYNGYAREFADSDADVIRGGALMKSKGISSQVISHYLVPNQLRELVLGANNRMEAEESVLRAYPSLNNTLEPRNYTSIFHNLVFLEEIQLWVEFRVYDRQEVFFKKYDKEYLQMEIDNVAETRPSLILGDIIRITSTWDKKRVYEGFIHKVLQNSVLVKFEKHFQNSYNGEKYNVQFQFSRGSFRKQHHAVANIIPRMKEHVVFPVQIEPKSPQVDVEIVNGELVEQKAGRVLNWFNPKLNESQKRAVKNILRGEARPMPYVIFGPPGTGKTYTVLEVILQIAKNVSHSRILVGASSNSAANLITERLISCKSLYPGDFIRIVGLSAIDKNSIPEHLHPYCALCDISIDGTSGNEIKETETGLKMHCNTKYLAEHKIIIGTCQGLGSFMALNLKDNHFTHVILDEAGQCNEPETIIPLSLLNSEMGQIILAGDPRQLGPHTISPIAKDHGLELSFLDRILERFPYEQNYDRHKHGFDERLVTQLIYNYRSLPSVLKLYSDLFYDGKLKATIGEEGTSEIAFLKKYVTILPDATNPNHGVFFFSIIGENRQSAESPSWYNAVEARNIFIFCTKLYALGIQHSDIGIIAPYKAQVKHIRERLRAIDEDKIPKVGSVEEFQGQERNIIILSTVRSCKNFLANDSKHSLGFVQNSKRLNVAISRAKSLLVIFGNAQLLANDPNWCSLIRYTAKNNAFIGNLPVLVGGIH
ncbi:probable RNA helicase armi [Phlebotomus argentipes]|uniref:probable RNA helicase armi n=1 Tax=Phlebotomus argentipes TaxID=94469 RepID=UPI0028932FD8|nr:probable RNA helicase armi [Phlebotomus argentipes]